MSVKLEFQGPADLSVGEIRISNNQGSVKKWMATPNERMVSFDVLPGYYVAEIAPPGVQSRAVVFEVRDGEPNSLSVPDFAALAASGRATNFLSISDEQKALQAILQFRAGNNEGPAEEPEKDARHWLPLAREGEDTSLYEEERSSRTAVLPRLISVGLSMEREAATEAWEEYDGACTAELSRGR